MSIFRGCALRRERGLLAAEANPRATSDRVRRGATGHRSPRLLRPDEAPSRSSLGPPRSGRATSRLTTRRARRRGVYPAGIDSIIELNSQSRPFQVGSGPSEAGRPRTESRQEIVDDSEAVLRLYSKRFQEAREASGPSREPRVVLCWPLSGVDVESTCPSMDPSMSPSLAPSHPPTLPTSHPPTLALSCHVYVCVYPVTNIMNRNIS